METVFSIAVCHHTANGNRKHRFYRFYPCSSIVDSVFDCRLPGVVLARSDWKAVPLCSLARAFAAYYHIPKVGMQIRPICKPVVQLDPVPKHYELGAPLKYILTLLASIFIPTTLF